MQDGPPGGLGTAARSGLSGAPGRVAPLPARQPIIDPPIFSMSLSELQARMLAGFMQHYQTKRGRPPTFIEMQKHFNRGHGTIARWLTFALDLGLVQASPDHHHHRRHMATGAL